MPKYRILKGRHRQRGVDYVEGDILESDKNLAKVFPNKFALADADAKVTVKPDPRPSKNESVEDTDEEEEDAEEKEADDYEPVESGLGKDVTADFPGINDDADEEYHVAIFKKGRSYYVAWRSDPEKKLRDKGITKKDAVLEFIETLFGDDENDE